MNGELKNESDGKPAQSILGIGLYEYSARESHRILLCRKWDEKNRRKLIGSITGLKHNCRSASGLSTASPRREFHPEYFPDIHSSVSSYGNRSHDSVLSACHSDNCCLSSAFIGSRVSGTSKIPLRVSTMRIGVSGVIP